MNSYYMVYHIGIIDAAVSTASCRASVSAVRIIEEIKIATKSTILHRHIKR